MGKNIWYICKYAEVLKYGSDGRQSYFCKEFVKKGHQATLIIGNSSHLFPDQPKFKGAFMIENIDGVNVVWINLPPYKKATSIKRFWTWVLFEYKIIRHAAEIANGNKPDVVIASSLSFLSIISGYFLTQKYKSRFIFEVRDIWPMSFKNSMGWSDYNPIILILRWLEKFGYKKADYVVGTMPGLHLHIQNSVKKKVNCICIPQGASMKFYDNQQEKLDTEFLDKYIPENKFTVTYAGTLGYSYGLDNVIKAAQLLSEKNTNIHFIFVGDGVAKTELKDLSKECKNVTFVPRIAKTKVLDFLRHSTVLLHSFEMMEEYKFGISPNKFIDYMYSERPVIVMFSGYQSIINEAGCGCFIPSEDYRALAEKLEEFSKMNKEQLDEMGKKGKQFLISNCRYEVLADKYLSIM